MMTNLEIFYSESVDTGVIPTYSEQLNTANNPGASSLQPLFSKQKVKEWLTIPTIAASLAVGLAQIDIPTHSETYAVDLTDRSSVEKSQSKEDMFLLRNPEVSHFIESGKAMIQQITGSRDITLELFKDEDEDFEKLFINIALSDEMFEQSSELEERLFEEWYLRAPETIRRDLVISLV